MTRVDQGGIGGEVVVVRTLTPRQWQYCTRNTSLNTFVYCIKRKNITKQPKNCPKSTPQANCYTGTEVAGRL